MQNPTDETGHHTLDIPVGAGSEAVYLLNVGTGELPESARFLEVTKESHLLLEDAAISHDGSRFAAVAGFIVNLWDGEASEWAVLGASRFLRQVVFGPSGRLLATIAIGESGLPEDSNLLLWNINTQKLAATLPISDLYTIRFSPDGRYIGGIGLGDPVVRVWGVP